MATTFERIQLNRKTAAQWSTANTVLLAGEAGVETDTLKVKVGDGVTAWATLPYLGSNTAAGVSSFNGRTGTVTATKADVGLGNVDNTADTAKPVSTAQAAALAAKITRPAGGAAAQYLGNDGAGGQAWMTIPSGGTAGAGWTVLAGSGIDPTGATNSLTAVQTLLNNTPAGSTVVIPDGATIRLNGGITLPNRIRLTGAGQLNFYNLTTGSINAITVTAAGTVIDGISIGNPSMTQPDPAFAAGGAQVAIYIRASDVTVTGCIIDKFESGIAVDSHGEYERFVITGNRISDVLGSGGGAADTTTQNGENRGDGISIWGAQAIITGNIINCRAGRDARIGIHHEGLASNEATTNAYADAEVIIANNIVYGQFRRGCATEGVARTVIVDNIISDATWWGIATTYGVGVTIRGNTVRWTRTSTDNQGAVWGPTRVPIEVFCNEAVTTDLAIEGNTVTIVAGAQVTGGGIHVNGDSAVNPAYNGLSIVGNRIRDLSGTMQSGIRFTLAGVGAHIRNNDINGFTGSGIYLETPTDFTITGNRLVGPGSAVTGSAGVFNNSAGVGGQVQGNRIRNVAKGVSLVSVTGGLQLTGNLFTSCGTGMDLFGTATPTVITGNLYSGVATPTANTPTGAVVSGNSA